MNLGVQLRGKNALVCMCKPVCVCVLGEALISAVETASCLPYPIPIFFFLTNRTLSTGSG